VRKFIFLFSLALVVAFGAVAAETLTLTDGGTLSGEMIKSDDNGLMLRLPDETYATTNVAWSHLSQESLKQLAANPKLKTYAEPFIEPDASQRPAKAEIKVNEVTRLERPAKPSLFGGLFGSPVGLFIFLVLYAANLYAGYEVAIIRARPAIQVIGLSAVLPVIGPVIFLAMPMKVEAPPESEPVYAPAGTATAAGQRTHEEIQIVEASWRQEEKKPEPQIFARGKFTFNKRFMETKFAGYIGAPKGEALKFTMELKTSQAQHAVEHILQVAATEVILETKRGQVTVPLADIQEIKLTPIPPAPAPTA
jgi:hypothetical protein